MGFKLMKVKFLPADVDIEVATGKKILVAARQAKLPIRFGCAACSCGTCAVLLVKGEASPMNEDEKAMLAKMKLPVDGSIRLSCQARMENEELIVDLSFQDKYSPDTGLD